MCVAASVTSCLYVLRVPHQTVPYYVCSQLLLQKRRRSAASGFAFLLSHSPSFRPSPWPQKPHHLFKIQNEPIFLEQISGTCWLDNNYKNLCLFVESLSFRSPHHHYKKLGFLFGRLGVGGRKMFVLPNCNFKLKVELSGSCAFSNAY